jgi:hypothetical protein
MAILNVMHILAAVGTHCLLNKLKGSKQGSENCQRSDDDADNNDPVDGSAKTKSPPCFICISVCKLW